MDTIPFVLIIISCVTHAYWNYLLKSSLNKYVFTLMSKLAEVVIFLAPALYFLSSTQLDSDYLILIIVASSLGLLNYIFLTKAYKSGDFSLVYPISRSSILFLPLLAYLFIEERIDSAGFIAITLILIGILLMHVKSFDSTGWKRFLEGMQNKGSIYAILAALALAGYTLWDKISVSIVHPFLYYYLYNSLIGALFGVFVLGKFLKKKISLEELKVEWRVSRLKSILAGFLNTISYMLVLIALMGSKASYVGALRLLSIVLGVFFAYKLLGESLTPTKIAGILISIVGSCLVYLAG